MAIHERFGDGNPVPTGISGDFTIGHEAGSEQSREALLAQRAMLDEALDRQAAGLTTPDEDQMIARVFIADQAHGYN